jgi:nitrogen fixation/metabolism regulation signal transduction histidine kinase
VGECKVKVYPRFSILFNSSLGQAKLESSKNHELARGYLYTLTQRASLYGLLILLIACIFGVWLLLGIIRPLNRLVQETREIGGGNLDVKVATGGNDELGDLSRAFSDMTLKLKNTMVSRDELAAEVVERKKQRNHCSQWLSVRGNFYQPSRTLSWR